MSDQIKWQPVMIVTNKRIECQCGAIAIFVTGKSSEDNEYNILEEADSWCQDCFKKSQEDEEDES